MAPILLNDDALEGERAELRHLEGHGAGFGLESPLVAVRQGVAPVRGLLIAPRTVERIGFNPQRHIERVLHGPSCKIKLGTAKSEAGCVYTFVDIQ